VVNIEISGVSQPVNVTINWQAAPLEPPRQSPEPSEPVPFVGFDFDLRMVASLPPSGAATPEIAEGESPAPTAQIDAMDRLPDA
jgi:hypothetical protein